MAGVGHGVVLVVTHEVSHGRGQPCDQSLSQPWGLSWGHTVGWKRKSPQLKKSNIEDMMIFFYWSYIMRICDICLGEDIKGQ